MATSKRAQFKGLTIVRVRDGKIVEGWNSFDQLGMLQQLGVVTLPGS
jgi:predicted ester cyclase